jgi:hypothetical protein
MTVQEYNDQLQHLIHLDPDHKVIERLKTGWSLTNETRLEHALASLPPPPMPESRRSSDAIVDRFYSQLNKEFTLRAQLSNSFHKLVHWNDDGLATITRIDDSKNITVQIAGVQERIDDLLTRKATYEQTKQLVPSKLDAETFVLPSDGIELIKKQNSVRANLSRAKATLKKLSKSKQPDKWLIASENVQRLSTELKLITDEVERRNNR